MGDGGTSAPLAKAKRPHHITYRCEGCKVGIQFDANELEEGETRAVACPNCGLETNIVSPPGVTEVARSILTRAQAAITTETGLLRDCTTERWRKLRDALFAPPVPPQIAPLEGVPVMGYVYVLSNPSMREYVKIGSSVRPVEKRVFELSGSTGVPLPFEIEQTFAVSVIPREAEIYVHRSLAQFRVNPKREFFKMPVNEAVLSVHKLLVEGGFFLKAPAKGAGERNSAKIRLVLRWAHTFLRRIGQVLTFCWRWIVVGFTLVLVTVVHVINAGFRLGSKLFKVLVHER